MHPATFHNRFTFCFLLTLFSTSLAFGVEPEVDVDQLSSTEIYQKWGQVLFCERIYKMPEVRSRLYDFDVEHCVQATKLVADVISKYSQQDQAQLNVLADRHAALLSRNTTEPYKSVPACREYCRKVAEFREERNDKQ